MRGGGAGVGPSILVVAKGPPGALSVRFVSPACPENWSLASYMKHSSVECDIVWNGYYKLHEDMDINVV